MTTTPGLMPPFEVLWLLELDLLFWSHFIGE